jgi:hypothetical protein
VRGVCACIVILATVLPRQLSFVAANFWQVDNLYILLVFFALCGEVVLAEGTHSAGLDGF